LSVCCEDTYSARKSFNFHFHFLRTILPPPEPLGAEDATTVLRTEQAPVRRLAAFVKTAITEKRERQSIAKTSEHLLEVPEEAHDFKATETIQRKLLKTMVKSYDNAKMKLIYHSNDGKT
jgi:hypothetical protein